jgi:hypothetical protein
MQVDLMQRFPMGILGFTDARLDHVLISESASSPACSRLMGAWRLAVELVTVARTRALLRRAPPVDHPRSIDRVIDYFGEPRRAPASRSGCYASRRVRTASS